jgi:ABC-type polysaccharide transport system permease subunit
MKPVLGAPAERGLGVRRDAAPRAGRVSRSALRRNLLAYAFIAPFMLLFVVFHVLPFFWALTLSTVAGDLVQPNKAFVGLRNYPNLTTDEITLQVFRNTLQYVVSVVPIAVVSALAMAFLIANRLVRFKGFFRAWSTSRCSPRPPPRPRSGATCSRRSSGCSATC